MRARAELVERYPGLLRAAMASFLADEQALAELLALRLGPTASADGLPRIAAVTTAALLRVALERWMRDEPGDEAQLAARIDEVLGQLQDLLGGGLPTP
jgi:hypothetical protein